ncbi:hypothetical protein [Thermomonas sp.]|uniref:hypothetical protein n=1 Tax=Thermomonas sp. TaxID=1971895 RepID=UPI0035B4CDE0
MAAEQSIARRLLQAGPWTWLLAALCGWALLVWLAALLGMGAHPGEVAAAPAARLPQPTAPSPDRLGPLAQYAEAASRPLFTDDRRPRAFVATGAEEGGAGSDAAAFDYLLTGVLISPSLRMAILQPSAGGASQRVREGHAPEGANGWRLLEVRPRSALFDGPGGQMTLELRTFGVAGMPPKPEPVAADAAAAATDAVSATVEPPPPPPHDDAAGIDDIRRRIEARRAQLQQQQPAHAGDGDAPPRPLSGPGK